MLPDFVLHALNIPSYKYYETLATFEKLRDSQISTPHEFPMSAFVHKIQQIIIVIYW